MHSRAISCSLLFLAAAPCLLLPQEPMPRDTAVVVGQLPTGLTYYVRRNGYPENRAELRLVVNAGSVIEDPDQRGLAHAVEHMAFNGTAAFPKHALVQYLERIGMGFGADLNATTRFDDTHYQLTIPTDSAGVLEQGVQILREWASRVTFDTAEIRRERGVLIEEWRLGRGAEGRLRDQTLPVLLHGSRYAERLPIGTLESLRQFEPAALVRYYRDWYRPDLMAVVAVGDFDPTLVERVIRQQFSSFVGPDRPRARPEPTIPMRTREAVVIATDPEATRTIIGLQAFRPANRDTTVTAYREGLVAALFGRMLNDRLGELAERPAPPFIAAGAGRGRAVRWLESFSLQAAVRDSQVLRGFEAILTEVRRVERHGFLVSELDRARRELLRGAESAYEERKHVVSAAYAGAGVEHFLTGEPMVGPEAMLHLTQRLLDSIALPEVNQVTREWSLRQDRVVTLTAPDAVRPLLPTREQVLALMEKVRAADPSPYTETLTDLPLVPDTLPEVAIVAETRDSVHGVTAWTLANGVRVILKPTDFKADQVVLTAYSPGGMSRLPDSLRTAAAFAGAAVRAGGLGGLSATDLEKKLAGRLVSVGPYIGSYEEGVSGSASRQDLATMLQLAYLLFTAPREDTAAFAVLRGNVRTQLAQRVASPAAAFQDTLAVTLAQHHPWSRPLTPARVDSVQVGDVYAAYRDRFADAGDMTFVLVGSFELDSLRPLVRRYLGSLPSTHRDDRPRDPGLRTPPRVVEREVRMGIAPQSQTAVVFSGPLEWTREERYALEGIAHILEVRLREGLREELSGTYGAQVAVETSRVPKPDYRVQVSYGSDPARATELGAALMDVVRRLRQEGPTAAEVGNWKQSVMRSREVALRENGAWASLLASADANGEDLGSSLDVDGALVPLTGQRLRQAAIRYLDPKRYVRVTLLPAGGAR